MNTLTDFKGQALPLIFTRSRVVVTSDTEVLEPGLLFVGVGGNIKVKLELDSDFKTFKNIPDGSIFTGSVISVHTDTTATDMIMVYV